MPDGARLGARIWLPDSAHNQPVPAILEYIPYRKDDYSAVRDSTTIAWFANRGYACVRVDMRGSGSSDGVLYDEYSEQEIDDGVAVINWIADQQWCDGNVGTMGISWGGVTGLQLAQRNPKPLKTVVALGASEFRYYDDGGYYMGCMVGQTIGWAAIMFGYNTRPPDPLLAGDGWRALWFDRLNNAPHYLDHWLTHQREDDYWLRGTVGTDYDAIRIPVYAVSGHADCWPNTVPRLLENLAVPKRGLQGAWCHRYPHLGIPGPTVGFLNDAARWFGQWLKHDNTGILDESTYQVYIQDSVRPKPYYDTRPGHWVGESGWPSAHVQTKLYYLGENELSESEVNASIPEICSPQTVGLAAGEYMPWFAFGPADELPGDQQSEDAGSLIFDTPILAEQIEILGNPEVEISVASDRPQALLAARLCDVWPDGASTLITRGLLNLSQRNGKRNPVHVVPGQYYTVKVTLNHVGYAVPAGHKIRLAVSTSYWPMAWPSPDTATVSVSTGSSRLNLPVRSPDADNGILTQFEAAQSAKPIATETLRVFKQTRSVTVDSNTGDHVFEISADNGKVRFRQNRLEMGSRTLQRYTIQPDDPLSARAEYEWEWEYGRGTDWNVKTRTRTAVTSDHSHFFVEAESVAWEDDEVVFSKQWDKKYSRDHF
ncbi:MAG: CocE/NonD family hydrolase [Gammaproteobacteria bacterium]|nr:CocE/NonD family hydrolase [Gammaproteobacteria bacterium]